MRYLVLLFVMVFGGPSFAAQGVVEVFYDGMSDSGSRTVARQEIFKEATEKMSEKYIIEIVGEEKYKKNKSVIENKIIKNSGKYVLFMKAQSADEVGPGTKMTVQMKISLDNLRKLLLQEGLFYANDGPPQVLPLVSFQDRVNSRSYSWWVSLATGDNGALVQQVKRLSVALKGALREKGFYAIQPVEHGFLHMVPEVYRNASQRTEDYLFLGDYFQAAIVIRGAIKTEEDRDRPGQYAIVVKLEALQSSNGRIIGEIFRKYNTEVGPFEQVVPKTLGDVLDKASQDLVVQIHDAWKRGTFGATLIRLTLKGPLSYQQLAEFKNLLESEVKGVNSLRERLLTSNSFTYEVDSSMGVQQLASNIERQNFPRFKVEVSNMKSDGLDLSVKAW